jgi:hypothetical protein
MIAGSWAQVCTIVIKTDRILIDPEVAFNYYYSQPSGKVNTAHSLETRLARPAWRKQASTKQRIIPAFSFFNDERADRELF